MDSEGSHIPATSPALGSALGQRSTAAHVLVVASGGAQPALQATLRNAGYDAFSVDDPYAALLELLVKPMVYRAVVMSLQGLYREELSVIRTLRARLPHVEVWLAHTDGRHAAMAEAVRLGAGGILSDEGLHRFDESASAPATSEPAASATLSARALMLGEPCSDAIPVAAPTAHSVSGESTGGHDESTGASHSSDLPDSLASGEPILSAEELTALLAEPEPASSGATWPDDLAHAPHVHEGDAP
jgi:DNA-binding NarL/FixJ family response regulator